MLRKTSLLFLAASMISCATVEMPTPRSGRSAPIIKTTTEINTPQVHSDSKKYHTIRKGDSFWRIAKRYNTSLAALRAANPALNPHDLKIGQTIQIPGRLSSDNSDFLWPVEGKVINFFGENVDGVYNNGINIAVTTQNKNVKAAKAGTVIFANKLKGWGTTVILQHYPDIYTIYANLDENAIEEGDRADKGTAIAKVASGKNGNHVLHFEVRKKSVPQNPLDYLN